MVRIFVFFLFLFSLSFCVAQNQDDMKSTATENVTIVDRPFIIEGLDRERQIRVYLPPNYEHSHKKYPVLYMHDGQNLFDKQTSYVGEWEIDETLNLLALEEKLELIVVGVDNGLGKRMNEMSPWDHEKYGSGEGKYYIDFIVNLIKPFIDSTFRTLTDRGNTGIMGSSMGGLISHYAIYEHPDVFSKAGIFSPSYWYSDKIFTQTKENPLLKDAKLYINVGKKEGSNMEKPAKRMSDFILNSGHPKSNIFFESVKAGTHSEVFWRSEFANAVLWLFAKEG